MSKKRMFSLDIVDSDAFLDMPLSSQSLYFHLSMRADDDGFVDNAKKIMRMVGSSNDDLKLLFAKNFVIAFEDGICVIKHWRIHNYIRADRKKHTNYLEQYEKLSVKENGAYTLQNGSQMSGNRQANVGIDKNRLVKSSLDKNILFNENQDIYKNVVSYLNKKANTKYKPSSNKTKTLIDARINDGFTLEDFKKVIDNKITDWLKNDMAKYLRPETLFGTKFESYLNQITKSQDSGIEWFDDYVKGKENA